MSEFRDLSRLPADPAYWDRLEARITAELGPRVRSAGSAWWAPVATRASGLGGLAVAAALATLLLVPSRAPDPVAHPTGLLRMPDDDPAMIAFVTAAEPPALAVLVMVSTGSGR